MPTQKYKLPEIIAGSLQMSAYNHRLMGIEALMSPISVNDIGGENTHSLNSITNTSAHLVGASPSQSASNWYRTKANYLHVQIDGCPLFIAPSAVAKMVLKSQNNLRYQYQTIIDPTSINTVTMGGTTTVGSIAKYNFIDSMSSGAEAVFLPDNVGYGVIWIINKGSIAFDLRLNSGSGSVRTVTSSGGKERIAKVGSVFEFV